MGALFAQSPTLCSISGSPALPCMYKRASESKLDSCLVEICVGLVSSGVRKGFQGIQRFLVPAADSSTTEWSEGDGLGVETPVSGASPITSNHDVFIPPGKRANDLTVTSCGIMQPFDIAGCLLILGNCKWASALEQIRFMGFAPN